MVTEDLALSGTKVFVTGVVYNDTVTNDNFFTVGEQVAGRAVTRPERRTRQAPAAATSSGSRPLARRR